MCASYFNICWLPFTIHFLSQLQYLMIKFSCMFDCPKNLITELLRSQLFRLIDALMYYLAVAFPCTTWTIFKDLLSPKSCCILFFLNVGTRVAHHSHLHFNILMILNLLTPNVNYSGRTAPLTSKVAFYIFIQQI